MFLLSSGRKDQIGAPGFPDAPIGRNGSREPDLLLDEHGAILHAEQVAADQLFGDLDGVERSALADVVGDNPHVEAVRDGIVLTDAPHIGRVFAGGVDREGVHLFGGVVVHLYAGGLRKDGAGSLAESLRSVSMFTDSEWP